MWAPTAHQQSIKSLRYYTVVCRQPRPELDKGEGQANPLDLEPAGSADDADVSNLAVLTAMWKAGERARENQRQARQARLGRSISVTKRESRTDHSHDGDRIGLGVGLAHAEEESALWFAAEFFDGLLLRRNKRARTSCQ